MMACLLALVAIAGTGEVYADTQKLAAIDKRFVCPETLHSEEAKIDALARFDADMRAAVLNLTDEGLGQARMHLLRKHRCSVTLNNLRRRGVR